MSHMPLPTGKVLWTLYRHILFLQKECSRAKFIFTARKHGSGDRRHTHRSKAKSPHPDPQHYDADPHRPCGGEARRPCLQVYTAVAAGGGHSVAVTSTGAVYVWGEGPGLGTGNPNGRKKPQYEPILNDNGFLADRKCACGWIKPPTIKFSNKLLV